MSSLIPIFTSVWFILSILAILVICEWVRDKNEGTMFFTSCLFIVLVLAICMSNAISLTVGIIILVLWVPVGLVWAYFFKWKARASKVSWEIESGKGKLRCSDYKELRDKLDINRQKGLVAYWTLMFPINIVSTLLLDIFDGVEYLVTVKLGKHFRNVADKALSDIPSIEK